MRFVIYDDESLEPITVINLRGVTERDIEEHGRRYRVAVPPELPPRPITAKMALLEAMRIVDLQFELLVRRSPQGREQVTYMCFTKQEELAMLLKPDWLPGQRPAIDFIERQNDALTKMLIGILTA